MANNKPSTLKKYVTLRWILALAIAVTLMNFIRFFLVDFVVVNGSSMYPTLINGERLLINRIGIFTEKPDKGDLVVFSSGNERKLIKRVIAVAGDRISMKSGKVYVNGKFVPEPYTWADEAQGPDMTDYSEKVVPENCIFVLGDNRNNSLDSRFARISFVNEKQIFGYALASVWPLKEIGRDL